MAKPDLNSFIDGLISTGLNAKQPIIETSMKYLYKYQQQNKDV